MPSSSNVDTRTFKQRKSFGKYFHDISLTSIYDLLFLATRKEEVAGIRSKFPNSTFVLYDSLLDLTNVVLEIPVIVERYHKEKDLPILGKVYFIRLLPSLIVMCR